MKLFVLEAAPLLLLLSMAAGDAVGGNNLSGDAHEEPQGNLRAVSRRAVWTPAAANGELHSVTREVHALHTGDGKSAAIIRECEDGRCQERRSRDDAAREIAVDFDRMVPEVVAPAPLLGFGFGDVADDLVDRLWFHAAAPTLSMRSPKGQAEDSVGRSVEVTEVDGKREEVEVVTRCHNGRCTRAERHAGAPTDVVPDREAQVLAAHGPDPASEVRQEDTQPTLHCHNGKCTRPEDAKTKSAAANAEAPAALSSGAAPISSQSVSESVVVSTRDGHREVTEVVTRCKDGKCTKEERHGGGGLRGAARPAQV
mmetsp:Transcript_133172/g.385277  ORF Transcript_133172/g.385277 Transcript_133172/m.385277 type:complete len:312 (+) Transcript_133172:90-1025(+)|eukprot:CAMPEP_0176015002 /NCGR_PEP_ID=MMETSP0120_2-20121206/7113_1 /TAXON_ID=160619 /ORGANISM="Kryptoperidinium foliaceum, Strain CCMP 1326" /LENGTH=311 /DNA_ID=CAMNT_0017347959 /DNA_START=74 /DNA_END=1009 /DNA_ORIENTATION=+